VKTQIFVVAALLVATAGFSQTEPSAQQLFEAGQYEPALRAVSEARAGGPFESLDRYLAVQIHLRLSRPADARHELESLATDPGAAWQLVAQSAQALIDGDPQRAFERATEAVAATPDHFGAQYQLGLVNLEREDWTRAGEAFERASRINPSFAYAFYHAGLAYSKVRRADKTAEHFERFLKLAPKAPERLAVESIMRTLRGR
jgi:tetratricopeptide (TPR) repeat protein